jgi:hypothetical protein
MIRGDLESLCNRFGSQYLAGENRFWRYRQKGSDAGGGLPESEVHALAPLLRRGFAIDQQQDDLQLVQDLLPAHVVIDDQASRVYGLIEVRQAMVRSEVDLASKRKLMERMPLAFVATRQLVIRSLWESKAASSSPTPPGSFSGDR